jgi:hypothetical protein
MRIVFILCGFLLNSLFVSAQTEVCLDLLPNPNPNDAALGVFTKYVNVLDCFEIYAESSISDDKVLFAAAVAAELLDNNEDGIVDDPLLKAQLASSQALMPLLSYEGSAGEDALMDNYEGEGISAVLYNGEIDPSQPGHWGDDASVEEILHTINNVGHTNIYPSAFSMQPNSSLMSEAMDVARGGQFINIPSSYPDGAWYHYDDYTCDYECMMIEYMYWAIVSNMGILDDTQTCSGIANEWEPCSPELFESMDVLMYALITDPQYLLPMLAPDGNYCPNTGVESVGDVGGMKVFPNPCSGEFQINVVDSGTVSFYSVDGVLVASENLVKGDNSIDVSALSSGVYYLVMGDRRVSLVVE